MEIWLGSSLGSYTNQGTNQDTNQDTNQAIDNSVNARILKVIQEEPRLSKKILHVC